MQNLFDAKLDQKILDGIYSRHFLSKSVIIANLDLMEMNKMNVFHWHITDSHSFPLEIKSVPELTEWGAYSKHQKYSQKDIKELVEYARVRGVKVIDLGLACAINDDLTRGESCGSRGSRGSRALCALRALWRALCRTDPDTGKTRGYLLLSARKPGAPWPQTSRPPTAHR
mgnify:CR=1 FL=1